MAIWLRRNNAIGRLLQDGGPIIKMQDNPLTIRPARDPYDQPGRQSDGSAKSGFDPRPINGDASFGHLLTQQRQAVGEQLQGDGLDEQTADLLPLMMSLARLSARAEVLGSVQ